MPWRKTKNAEASPFKLLLWTAIAGVIFGLIGLGELPEDMLRASRNNFHRHAASGDIVLVKIDDRALQEVGQWPWPRRRHAELIERLTEAGAKRIFFDVYFETRSDAVEDRLLAGAIERSGRVVLPVRGETGPHGLAQPASPPLAMFSRHAELGSIAVHYNYQNAVWRLPYSIMADPEPVPSFAAKLANHQSEPGEFIVDYSLNPSSIPTVGAEKVLAGSFDAGSVRGKDVVIGTNTKEISDHFFIPGVGKMGGVYIQIIGAETLKAGKVVHLGWLAPLLLALATALYAVTWHRSARQNWIFAGATATLLVAPIPFEANLIFIDVAPALFVLLTIWATLGWRSIRRRGLINVASGLSNLNALRASPAARDRAIIVARVLNYAEAVAALPQNCERQLIDQIVARLSVGSPERILYQGDGGIFAWLEEPRLPFSNHIDALYALFRNPARVNGLPVDLSVSFGVEIGSRRSISNRLASALVAAEEAAHHGLRWKYHDPESLEHASWKLSILSQLDEAVDKGEVWVAYQPKLEIATRRMVGAEALARWTHPEKGPIAASEFVAAAEQNDRIAKLTDFVLDEAIAAAVALNRHHHDFGMAVNLSARLLSDPGFVLRLTSKLARHRLPPHLLTLELTETAAVAGSGVALDVLGGLRELGVRISIDDYGTGLSTLDYLKKIPASEIKIDQSFVKGLLDNPSDRLMVQSTIGLVHSLGRTVVAEGVEDRQILEALAEMECDIAQGFIIGRPMSMESLVKRIGQHRTSQVA